jgi:hypothetical protein
MTTEFGFRHPQPAVADAREGGLDLRLGLEPLRLREQLLDLAALGCRRLAALVLSFGPDRLDFANYLLALCLYIHRARPISGASWFRADHGEKGSCPAALLVSAWAGSSSTGLTENWPVGLLDSVPRPSNRRSAVQFLLRVQSNRLPDR